MAYQMSHDSELTLSLTLIARLPARIYMPLEYGCKRQSLEGLNFDNFAEA